MRVLLGVLGVLGLVLATVSFASAQAPVTLQNAATATGNGHALTLGSGQIGGVAVQVIPNQVATYQVAWEASLDNVNYDLVTCYYQGGSSGATSITTTRSIQVISDRALYRCNVLGYRYFRARIVSITSASGGLTIKAVPITSLFSQGALTP